MRQVSRLTLVRNAGRVNSQGAAVSPVTETKEQYRMSSKDALVADLVVNAGLGVDQAGRVADEVCGRDWRDRQERRIIWNLVIRLLDRDKEKAEIVFSCLKQRLSS